MNFDKGRFARSSFFVEGEYCEGGKAVILGFDARHIIKVLRLKKGDMLNLFDDMGYEYASKIVDTKDMKVETVILEKRKIERVTKCDVVLGQCIPKITKMDIIVQKTVEIGVREIVPLVSSRTIIKDPKHPALTKRYERWKKVGYEAVKQCGRGEIPAIGKPIRFGDFVNSAGDKVPWNRLREPKQAPPKEEIHRFMLSSDVEDEFLKEAIERDHGDGCKVFRDGAESNLKRRIYLVVGPEGGFTDEEKEMAVERGFIPVKISPNILRVETAAILGVGIILHEFEM